jgi:hypothetical protein
MPEHVPPPLNALDLLLPVVLAGVFIVVVSLIREPGRQRFMAIFVAGAGAAYLNGGLGLWEFAFTTVATALAYLGLGSYRFIAAAWVLHSGWDVMHHLYGQPIVFLAPTSSAGCAIADALIAIWFFFGARSVFSGADKNKGGAGFPTPPSTLAQKRTRTSTVSPPPDPESGVSTNSTTWAEPRGL